MSPTPQVLLPTRQFTGESRGRGALMAPAVGVDGLRAGGFMLRCVWATIFMYSCGTAGLGEETNFRRRFVQTLNQRDTVFATATGRYEGTASRVGSARLELKVVSCELLALVLQELLEEPELHL